MIPHLTLATLCNDIYAGQNGFDHYWVGDDVVVGLKVVDGANVIVLRGSVTTEDWMRDGAAVPVWHAGLGFLHAGFASGMDNVFTEICKVLDDKPIEITGHSLGGARARILTGLFAVNKIQVQQLCTFGSPKPAFINLARVIEKAGILHSSYRNRRDVVPTLPLFLPMWQHTEPWHVVDAAPAEDNLQALRDHSCALYVKALETTASDTPS